MSRFSKTLLASALTLVAGGANASAFQLAEVSTSGLGMAYAGNAAVADNASVIATNPALMTRFQGAEMSVGGILVDTDLHIQGKTKLGNSANQNNVVPTSLIPNAYFVAPINDKFALGLGYNVNFGLSTEYSNSYNAGTLGGQTELQAHNFNLSGAYNIGNGFSFGAGVNAIYSKAEVRRTLGDQVAVTQASATRAQAAATALQSLPTAYQSLSLTTLAAAQPANKQLQAIAAQFPAGTTASQAANSLNALATSLSSYTKETEVTRITGDKWSFGWNAGLAYELNENNRWGLAYHSAVDVKFNGKYRNALSTNLGSVIATNGEERDGKLTLNLPAYWELSGYHKLTDRFAVQYSWKRTEWSRYAVGVSYEATQDLTLRAGLAYDRSASVNHPSISIPDTNRMWYSAGATYKFTPNLSTDVGFAYLHGTKFGFGEDGATFKVRASGYLYGLNLNYKF